MCAEQGIPCDTTDINPFLLWLAAAKTRIYTGAHLRSFHIAAGDIAKLIQGKSPDGWTPALFQIEKWWEPSILASLSRAMRGIRQFEGT